MLLNLYKIFSDEVRSKFESRVNVSSVDAVVCSPEGDIEIAVPPISLIAYPGLLSMACSPGKRRIVVFSVISLLLPFK